MEHPWKKTIIGMMMVMRLNKMVWIEFICNAWGLYILAVCSNEVSDGSNSKSNTQYTLRCLYIFMFKWNQCR